ncbi:MAG: hypothetical protein ABI461_05855 [Polyangiaceae bacterium]
MREVPLLALIAGVAISAAACGAAGGTFDGHEYRKGDIAFRVGEVPASWKRLDVSDASLAFRDDAHAATILLNARCGGKDDDVPLVALTGQLIMGTTDREYSKEETIPFDGREARHSVLKAKLDGVLLAYDIYVEKKDGCTYDFVYISPPAAAGAVAGSPEFEHFVGDFRTLGGSGNVKVVAGDGS